MYVFIVCLVGFSFSKKYERNEEAYYFLLKLIIQEIILIFQLNNILGLVLTSYLLLNFENNIVIENAL